MSDYRYITGEVLQMKMLSLVYSLHIWSVWMAAPSKKFVIINIQACSDILVALSETTGIVKERAYIITLFGTHGPKTAVRKSLGGSFCYSCSDIMERLVVYLLLATKLLWMNCLSGR